jgi:predicted DNA-binding transcriptional regulator AlpA
MSIDPNTLPLVITSKHIRELTAFSESTIDRLDRDGRMPPSFKVSRKIRRWSRDQVLMWIADGCPPVSQQAQTVTSE